MTANQALPANEALQLLIGASVISVEGSRSSYDPDEVYDFRIFTDKGVLYAYVTNGEGIAMEWKP